MAAAAVAAAVAAAAARGERWGGGWRVGPLGSSGVASGWRTVPTQRVPRARDGRAACHSRGRRGARSQRRAAKRRRRHGVAEALLALQLGGQIAIHVEQSPRRVGRQEYFRLGRSVARSELRPRLQLRRRRERRVGDGVELQQVLCVDAYPTGELLRRLLAPLHRHQIADCRVLHEEHRSRLHARVHGDIRRCTFHATMSAARRRRGQRAASPAAQPTRTQVRRRRAEAVVAAARGGGGSERCAPSRRRRRGERRVLVVDERVCEARGGTLEAGSSSTEEGVQVEDGERDEAPATPSARRTTPIVGRCPSVGEGPRGSPDGVVISRQGDGGRTLAPGSSLKARTTARAQAAAAPSPAGRPLPAARRRTAAVGGEFAEVVALEDGLDRGDVRPRLAR